jgi:ABC-type nitrate/sulfonate/bicarbonate transport system substrate-binding protein
MTGALHSRLFRASAAAALAVIILGLAYLSTRDQPLTQNSPTEKLSIATPTVPHAALLHIAAAKGYFAEEGLEVTMMPTIHGKAAIDLVSQGKADLGAASEVVFVLATTAGGALGIAANMVSNSNDLAVVARRDHGIAAPRDLVGKKVGGTLGTAGEYFLWAFFIRNKLPPGSVTLVDMPPGQIAPAIAAGTIDATSTWQPNVLNVQRALSDNAVTFYEPESYTETFNVIGRSDFLKGHVKAIEKLMRAMLKAEQFMQSRPEETLNLVAEWLKIDVDALRRTWKQFDFRVNLLQSQLITLEDEARWAMARGYAATGPVPNFLPHLYLDALLAVEPERVTVLH